MVRFFLKNDLKIEGEYTQKRHKFPLLNYYIVFLGFSMQNY